MPLFGQFCSKYFDGTALGVMAWNLSTFEEPRRTEELGRFMRLIDDGHVSNDLQIVMRNLVARKLTLFPYDNRFIVAWDVKPNKNHFHITAAAIVPNADSKKLEHTGRRGYAECLNFRLFKSEHKKGRWCQIRVERSG